MNAINKLRIAAPIVIVTAIACTIAANMLIKPYPTPEIIEIGPNQTAFLIPLEGGDVTNQSKFQSVDLLKKNQVAVKRVQIPKVWKKTGYLPSTGQWMPSAKTVLVDRNLVTREWKDMGSGHTTDPKNQAISVESRESITFQLQVMVNAVIKEEDAANFLYWYGGKSLADIMDTNVRADVADALAKAFGMLPLDQCRAMKGAVFTDVRTSVTELYAQRGITITTLGVNGGLVYADASIQKSMNEQFLSQNAKIIADNKHEEQRRLNAMKLEQAETERKSAEEIAKNEAAFRTVRELEIRKLMAERWDGHLPRIIFPAGTGSPGASIMNLPADLFAEPPAPSAAK